jgi:hypothetical protein
MRAVLMAAHPPDLTAPSARAKAVAGTIAGLRNLPPSTAL